MKIRPRWSLLAAVFSLMALSVSAQERPSAAEAFRMARDTGVPIDWTHHHVIFSSSPTDSETLSYIQQDPRYWLQLLRRGELKGANAPADPGASDPDAIQLARGHTELLENSRIGDSEKDDTDSEKRPRGRPWGRWERWRNKALLEPDWNEALNAGFNSFGNSKFPAKYTFNSASTMPDCTNDYVVFATGLSGPPTTFNLIAFKNLYLNSGGGSAFCAGATPTLLFAYYTSTGSSAGGLNTSPALSLDGTQIAFVEAASSGAILHVLKWQAAASTPPFPNITATLHDCAVSSAPPCEYSVAYAGVRTATRSSPYV